MWHADDVVALIDLHAEARGIAPSTSSRHLSGSGDLRDRLGRGCDLTLRRAEAVVQRASDHWPIDAPWPESIPRPEPAPDSPAAEAARAARASDPRTALDGRGRIADPAGFCRRLFVRPHDLARTVKLYGVGGRLEHRRPPRRRQGSKTRTIWDALLAAGDRRIAGSAWVREAEAESARIEARLAEIEAREARAA